MIWNSLPLMTGFDVLILVITLMALWTMLRYRRLLVQAKLIFELSGVISGLLLIGLFYLTDLVTMWVMPLFTTQKTAMAVMTSLHLHYNWIHMLAVTLCICVGFVGITRRLLFSIDRLEDSEAHFHREIESRRQVNNELRESEERFQALIENNADIICVIDAAGVVQYYSPSIERVLGYRPEEVMGRHVFGAFHPDDVSHIKAMMATVLDHPGHTQRVEYRARHRDSSWHDFEAMASSPPEGLLMGDIVVNARDITERKQTEEELLASEGRFRDLVEGSIQGMLIHRDGHPLFVNQAFAAIFDYAHPQDILTTRGTVDLIAPHERTRLRQIRNDRLAGKESPNHYEYEGLRKDGTSVWLESRVRMVTWEGAPAIQSTVVDISERKQAEDERQHLEAQLRQSQKMEAIGTLAGGIAHEFNNILSIILGYTDLSQYEVPQGSNAWSNMQAVLTAVHRAKDLVQQILAFSRPSAQEREPLSVSLVVQEALPLLRATLPSTIAVCQHLSEAEDMVLANRTQLHQMLLNLCTNAEQAMRETGGVLEIGVDHVEVDAAGAAPHPDLQPGPYVRVWVRDTGPGMPPDVMERIFEPFYTTKGVGEGTGMGLAIVHGMVTSHDGTITVKSTPGDGSVFTIYLPQIAAAAVADAPGEATISHGTERLLFVDDEAVLARVGHAMLARLGYDVVAHTSGVAALEAFQATPHDFDLVITDHTMPQMTGEALARELRGIRPDIPIILCTGFSHTMTAEKAHAMGIDAFCMKPLMSDDLAVTIQQVLGKRAKQDT